MATTCEGGPLFALCEGRDLIASRTPCGPGHPTKLSRPRAMILEAYCLNGNWSSLLAGLVFDDIAGDGAGRDGVRAG